MSGIQIVSLALTLAPPAQKQSICGVDERRPEQHSAVGIVRKSGATAADPFCTVTLVSESCALTAGHCLHVLQEAEFFSHESMAVVSSEESTYEVDQSSIRALQSRIGNDWAVLRLRPNRVTGLLAGKAHGFVDVELDPEHETPPALRLFATRKRGDGQFEMVSSEGAPLWVQHSILFHDVDTGPGSSGALVVSGETGRAIAIHTHGGCETMKNNKATYISQQPYLRKAIEMCRSSESGL